MEAFPNVVKSRCRDLANALHADTCLDVVQSLRILDGLDAPPLIKNGWGKRLAPEKEPQVVIERVSVGGRGVDEVLVVERCQKHYLYVGGTFLNPSEVVRIPAIFPYLRRGQEFFTISRSLCQSAKHRFVRPDDMIKVGCEAHGALDCLIDRHERRSGASAEERSLDAMVVRFRVHLDHGS